MRTRKTPMWKKKLRLLLRAGESLSGSSGCPRTACHFIAREAFGTHGTPTVRSKSQETEQSLSLLSESAFSRCSADRMLPLWHSPSLGCTCGLFKPMISPLVSKPYLRYLQ